MPQDFAAKPRYEILNGLRGVAAFIVILFHIFESYAAEDHTRTLVNHGYLAVDFFFALSGFVIGYAYDDRWKQGMTTWGFFKRRLIRLHPLLIFGTVVGALCFYFHDGNPCWTEHITSTSPWKMLGIMLFCFTLIPCPKAWDIRGWADTNPLNGAVWSLQWEYVANILYATVIRRFRTWALALLVAVAAAMTVVLCLNLDVTGWLKARDYAAYTVIGGWSMDPDQLQVGLTRLLYPFFSGLLLARLKWIIPVRRGGFLLCAALISIAFAMPYFAKAPWQNGLYEAAVILFLFPLVLSLGAGSVTPTGWLGRFCRFAGEISFPIYIIHQPIVQVHSSWLGTHPNAPFAQHVAVAVSVVLMSVAVAWAALKLYDLPIRNWLKKGLMKWCAKQRKGDCHECDAGAFGSRGDGTVPIRVDDVVQRAGGVVGEGGYPHDAGDGAERLLARLALRVHGR